MTQYLGTTQKPLSIVDLANMKLQGEKIACLTAYDASFSRVLDEQGVDVILVGDSLGMVIQGHETTLPVSMNDMIYHTRHVARYCSRAFVVADLPFLSYPTPLIAAQNAARLMQEANAQMVKLEGVKVEIIRFMTEQGIPVCGHLGLLPQSINQLGRYQVQGKTAAAAAQIVTDAKMIQQAGAKLLVLECVPASLAKKISSALKIPVIGIGAGVDCDGQVLVLYDMLNISNAKRPRFSKDFLRQTGSINAAIKAYVAAVKAAQFPAPEHSY
jgi:3-methyl-2-oxobutanoate hydroxymethyltransferase